MRNIKEVFGKRSKPNISEIYWNRLKKEIPNITKKTIIDNYGKESFEYIEYLNNNSSPIDQVKTLEMFIEDAKFKLVYTKDNPNKANFYDLITPVLKENYSLSAQQIKDIIEGKLKLSCDSDIFGNVFSQPTGIANMIHSRDLVYKSIKRQAKKDIIDITDLSYAGYISSEGMLAYQKTINSQDYTINQSSDKIFRNLLDKNIFLKKESPAIEIIYSGTAFLEMEWAKSIHAQYNPVDKYHSRQIELIDCSGIPLNYMFSNDRPKHKSGVFDSSQLVKTLGNELKNTDAILIKNNAIHSENIGSVLKEMNEIQKLNSNTGIFYTAPIIGCTTTESHYASNHSFGKHFIENVLLSNIEKFTSYATPKLRKEGIVYEIGFIANENIQLYNQTLTDRTEIKKGTKIIYYNSWRYNEETIDKFIKLAGAKITEPIDGVIGIYK
ncbi:MAG: hypothetical protein ACP5N1_06850 [Candidatus Woesearchaeota archaeon]